MKKTHLLLLSLFITAFAISGCSGGKAAAGKKNDIEKNYIERYEDGLQAFEDKKYYKSIEDFTFVVFNAPGSDIADNAQFHLAGAHFAMKEYLLALDQYQQLLRRWPESDLYEETRFKIAECYYLLSPGYQRDEEYIHKAINAYQNFIETYPLSAYREKAEERIRELRTGLAKKSYEAGELYMVLHEWNAAIITFEEIINSYYDTSLLNPSYLKMAECYYMQGNTEMSVQMLNKVNPDKLKQQDKRKYKKLFNDITATGE